MLLVPREKTKDELDMEEEEYKDWLEREVGEDLRQLVTIDAAAMPSEEAGAEDIEKKQKKGKKERKAEKEGKGTKASKEESDQQFLLECVSFRL